MIIVCPFSRPQNLGLVLSMWQQQTRSVGLVLVAKDRSWDVLRAESAGAIVLSGCDTVGGAKNAGIGYGIASGESWATVWDDDDYYGPQYVEQAEDNIDENVDVLTQGIGFVRFEDGLYYFEKPIHFTPGHCTTFRLASVPKFPEASLGEDVDWSHQLDWSRVRQIPPWHMVYHREGTGHAFETSKVEFAKQFEPSRYIGDVPDTFVDAPTELSSYPRFEVSDEQVFDALRARLARHHGYRA